MSASYGSNNIVWLAAYLQGAGESEDPLFIYLITLRVCTGL